MVNEMFTTRDTEQFLEKLDVENSVEELFQKNTKGAITVKGKGQSMM